MQRLARHQNGSIYEDRSLKWRAIFYLAEVSLAWGHSTETSLAVEGHLSHNGVMPQKQLDSTRHLETCRSPPHWLQGSKNKLWKLTAVPRLLALRLTPPQQRCPEDEWTLMAFLRCILIQALLPQWVRGGAASSCTLASTFPCLAPNYITRHIFFFLETWFELQRLLLGWNVSFRILTLKFSKDEIPVCWNYEWEWENKLFIVYVKEQFQAIVLNNLLTPVFILGWTKQPEHAWVSLCCLCESSSAGIP